MFSADHLRGSGCLPLSASGFPDGLSGCLRLSPAGSLNQERTGSALQGLRLLEGWAAAAKVRLIYRQHVLMMEELQSFNAERAAEDAVRGRAAVPRAVDAGLAFSLTATEVATMLGIPEGTAKALVDEACELCERCPSTLDALERAAITPAQALTILDQTRSLVAEELPPPSVPAREAQVFPPGAAHAMEQELLKLAPGLTNAQLVRKARRLRERSYPETIPVRHRKAFEQRRVWFQPQPDGMGHLTAYLPADKGQGIFGALTGAARGEQLLGDPRGLDQLRADILASLLLHTPEPWIGEPEVCSDRDDSETGAGAGIRNTSSVQRTDAAGGGAVARDECETRQKGAPNVRNERQTGPGGMRGTPQLPSGTVAEIMVLINADTLFGADNAPAELAGYGPISAEAARRLARTACRWTGLVQDARTGEVLGVGRRRKVPAGLRRWLQARDQTCRFPGCSTGTARTETDHTIPWAQGGPTEHWNLANLCKKHHRLKTLGHWKAQQVSPGVLEWISPLGRHYQTQPELTLGQLRPALNSPLAHTEFELGSNSGSASKDGDPPPF
ncbi:DUF222 domain-containing protein [Arthrobacter sp. NPDC097144]|uniref:HNH endonuclease signature motif containing protein n=1 Tax=Arthrobacter sp. NPDC097144 TaxID=3363946 RepID=UPI0038043F7A